jgi:hypothetical protein
MSTEFRPGISDSRSRGALYGLYIGDALAMPVHWYYNREALSRASSPIPTLAEITPTAELCSGPCSAQRKASNRSRPDGSPGLSIHRPISDVLE